MIRCKATILSLAMLMTCGAASFAADEKPWKETAELSAVSTNGNSKATTISGKNTVSYAWSKAKLEVIAGGLGSESQDRTTAEQYFANELIVNY